MKKINIFIVIGIGIIIVIGGWLIFSGKIERPILQEEIDYIFETISNFFKNL